MGALEKGDVEGTVASRDLKSLILAKERELGELEEYRVSQLEKYGKERDLALQETRLQLAKLTEDFRYNLSLIEERDAELSSLETEICILREAGREQDVQMSELRRELDEEKREKSGAVNSAEEREAYYAAKLRESREEAEALRYKIVEKQRLFKEREASLQAECAHRVRKALETSESARSELAAALDEASARREVESRAASEQAEQEIRCAQTRSEAAERRAAVAVKACADAEAAQEAAEQRLAESSRQIQRERWEREDASRRAADREKQLEERVAALRAAARLNDDETQARIGQVKAECEAHIQKTRRELQEERIQALEDQKLFFHKLLNETKEKEEASVHETKQRLSTQYEHETMRRAQDAAKAAELATRAALETQHASLRDAFDAKFIAAKAAWALEINAVHTKHDHTLSQLNAVRTELQAMKTQNTQLKSEAAVSQQKLFTELAGLRAELRSRDMRITQVATELAASQSELKALREAPPPIIDTSRGNASPLFSDDAGAASPFSMPDASSISYKDEALRLRTVVASMRADLESIRAEFSKVETERTAEISILKRREADAVAARRNAANAVSDRLDTLENDLTETTRKLHSTIVYNNSLIQANIDLKDQLHAYRRDKKLVSTKSSSRRRRHHQRSNKDNEHRHTSDDDDDDEEVDDTLYSDDEKDQPDVVELIEEIENIDPPPKRQVSTRKSVDQIRAQLRQRGPPSAVPKISKQAATSLQSSSRRKPLRSAAAVAAATVRNYNQKTDEQQ